VRSSYVQHHGIRANATVESVVNTQHCSRGGCNYTSAIFVTLSPPIDGAQTTVVHSPDFSNLFFGLQVPVLVDPQEPSYAELPGSMFEYRWSWILLLLLGVLFAWLAIVEGRVLRRLLTHRREHQAHTRVRMTATP
jgi:hypothetical protein